MQIDIITLFPEMFEGPLTESIVKRAQEKGLVEIKTHQLRDYATDKHKTVDEKPYGGGPGMVMRVDVAFAALRGWLQKNPKSQIPISNKIQNSKSKKEKPYIILPTPKGKKFDQKLAQKLAKKKHLVFLCPHYEGYDHRIESLVDEKISIGNYILTGGEIPVMAIVDSVVRLLPGVINQKSLNEESFAGISNDQFPISNGGVASPRYLEYPQYTRPAIFEIEVKGNPSTSLRTRKIKKRVPKVLLSGHHEKIKEWREKMS